MSEIDICSRCSCKGFKKLILKSSGGDLLALQCIKCHLTFLVKSSDSA
jgi:hypothetical protein